MPAPSLLRMPSTVHGRLGQATTCLIPSRIDRRRQHLFEPPGARQAIAVGDGFLILYSVWVDVGAMFASEIVPDISISADRPFGQAVIRRRVQ